MSGFVMAPTKPPAATGPDIVAAGAVVTRKGPEGREVLVVHRPKYDDWSFPKGKQDPGEHVTTTAVREVLEETGVEIRLGRPLRPQLYAVSGGRGKKVHYWVGHVLGGDDLSLYQANEEVDDLGWFSPDTAAERLTYLDDIDLLDQLGQHQKATSSLVVLRHAKAHKRGTWDGPDPKRPLAEVGQQQSRALVPLLRAYGVTRVLSSSSIRCVQTVEPYADDQLLPVVEVDALSEELYDEAAARELLNGLMTTPGPSVLCSHRPVLPHLFDLLGITEEPLSPGEFVVHHHRKGAFVAAERHRIAPVVP
jgi:8-oxo-dGTP pyrophosphatase MutT (NUDIX family)/phosphohistidine phosphatase SixA